MLAAITFNDTILSIWLINAILAFSAFIVVYGGGYSFAFVAFIGLGSYTSAIVQVDHGLPIWAALLISPVIAMAAGAVISKPLQRLEGTYLAIVSVGVVVVFQTLLLNFSSITGGAMGKVGIPVTVELPHLVVVALVVVLLMVLLQRSNLGRALRLMRIDPIVAQAIGIDVARARLGLLVASAAVGAVGGVLRSGMYGVVTPTEYGFDLLTRLIAIVIIGGAMHWSGPFIGAFVFAVLPEWLPGLGPWRNIATGICLLVVVIRMPQGIAGEVGDWLGRLGRGLARRSNTRQQASGSEGQVERTTVELEL